jgi:hypothetical protein
VIARQSLPKTQRTLHKVRAATRKVDDDLSGVESLISSRDVSLAQAYLLSQGSRVCHSVMIVSIDEFKTTALPRLCEGSVRRTRYNARRRSKS